MAATVGEDVAAASAAAAFAWLAAPSCCSTGSSTEPIPFRGCLCFLFDRFARLLGKGSSGLLNQGSYIDGRRKLAHHITILSRKTGSGSGLTGARNGGRGVAAGEGGSTWDSTGCGSVAFGGSTAGDVGAGGACEECVEEGVCDGIGAGTGGGW